MYGLGMRVYFAFATLPVVSCPLSHLFSDYKETAYVFLFRLAYNSTHARHVVQVTWIKLTWCGRRDFQVRVYLDWPMFFCCREKKWVDLGNIKVFRWERSMSHNIFCPFWKQISHVSDSWSCIYMFPFAVSMRAAACCH